MNYFKISIEFMQGMLPSPIVGFVQEKPLHLLIVGGFLGVLILAFIVIFFLPALWRGFQLSSLNKKLKALSSASPDTLEKLDAIFGKTKKNLRHLWRQYKESLHIQYDVADSAPSIHATAPAELYFGSFPKRVGKGVL
ncbi:MAG: hypothetical protein LBU39_08750 [Desulfobulbaceae bacterium]|jgi:hypothetical protein|nr:hypothetical protein [Desulfobulbaceae bacterium]